MIEVVFYIAAGLLVYTYALFPLLVVLRGLLLHRRISKAVVAPTVSLIIAAHNESASIEEKLKNATALDYPRDRLEILVASDGSNDGTNAVVERYANEGIRLLALPRRGKADTLNKAVAETRSDVLVFSDANSIYAPDALRRLVESFADPTVGGVAGNQVYGVSASEGVAGGGERAYWSFDRILKYFESRPGNTISATGAIYAIRRELFQPIPAGVTDDFFTSTGVITAGFRLVFEHRAVAYEFAAATSDAEFARKVRVITQGLRGVLLRRSLFNPFRYGFYSVQLLSHKLLRRMMAVPLLALLAGSVLLCPKGLSYQVLATAQLAFYGCALMGMVLASFEPRGLAPGRMQSRIRMAFTLPFYFCLVNAAALVATFNMLIGRRIDRWEPRRQTARRTGHQDVTDEVSTGRSSA